jgi:hypothetical protein
MIEPTRENFRSDDTRVTELRTLVHGEVLNLALRTVRAMAPERRYTSTTSERDAARFAQSIGWHQALDTLISLAAPQTSGGPSEPELPTEAEIERHLNQ